ncbi:sulfite exporter TauE/SafE family protein [Marinilabiliaceae bacterium JC017]|nr:sulfite exporter TauE/SafE family protein [Marinilabiliaceae bacterium JC017]
MSATQIIILLVIGLLGGIVSGALGVGGGIIIVPALVFFMGYSQHLAQGTSLAILLPPTGILAAMQYYKNGFVDIKVAIILMLIFVLGAYLGSMISLNIPAKTLKKVFGIFMLLVSIKIIFSK